MNLYISDMHFGHKNVIGFDHRPFADVEEMDHYIMQCWNSRVQPGKNSNENYTEPHHLVPLFAQKDFPNVNLDREQNIVSLCSHCHNLLHYGAD